MGSSVELLSTEDEGIIPRAVRLLYHLMSTEHSNKVINQRISFLEIYNEEIRDLIHPDVPPRDIAIREDNMGRIFFTGAREEVITCAEDVFKFLEQGALNRTTGETLMNDASSRSHAIFTLSMEIYECKVMEEEDGKEQDIDGGKKTEISSYIHSKLHLVDLAGSERAKRTGAVGVRLKESVGINQGLLSLGKVIRALTTPASKTSGITSQHVPYRESKLTRFLQDSLGGNSRTAMIACVSPAEGDMHETLTTLQYASRARAVQNKVKANVTVAQVAVEDGIVEALRLQLSQAQAQLKEREMMALESAKGRTGVPQIADIIGAQKRGIIIDRLVGVQHVLQKAVKYFDGGVDSGAFQMDSCHGEAWEDTVCSLHNCSSILEDVASLVRESSSSSVASDAEAIEGSTSTTAAAAKTIQKLRIELAECREDLKRDEEIFADKVLELKQTRRSLRKAQDEISSLREDLRRLEEKLAAQSSHSDEYNPDNMDISMAVANSEPHVSQLLEDLEAISREKEKLSAERDVADKKCALATALAEKQKEDFDSSRSQLKRRLKELEIGIKMKQEVISTMAKEQKQTSDRAELFASRIEEMEKESAELKSKLSDLAKETSTTDEVIKGKQKDYELKIRQAQEEIAAMRKQWKREQQQLNASMEMTASIRDDGADPSTGLLHELQAMKKEHTRLRTLMEADESKQKQKVDSLSKQVESYKKRASESQKQIRSLEARNAELQESLASQAKGCMLPPPPRQGAADGTGGYLRRHSGDGGKGQKTPRGAAKKSPSAADIALEKEAQEWIKGKIQKIFSVKAANDENSHLQSVLDNLTCEKEKIEKERRALIKQQQHGEAALSKQCKEVEGRIQSQVQVLATKKKALKLAQENDREFVGSKEEASMLTEIADADKMLRSYQEHLAELTTRIDSGALPEKEIHRLQELNDELETIDAEIQLNELHQSTLNKTVPATRTKAAYQTSTELSDGGVPPSVRELEDALISEMQSKLEGDLSIPPSQSKYSPTPAVTGFLSYLTREAIEEKLRSQKTTQDAQQVKLQLDDKNAEFEQLALVLHRTRSDLTRKLEKQQKEYEDKIAFLIQQLRGAELKIHESSLMLRKSLDGGGDSSHDTVGPQSTGSMFLRPRTTQSLTRPHVGSPSRTTVHKSGNDDHDNEVADALRKWEGERQRRELLEKRNGELMRELRMYRQRERK
eukprot:CAMPEP_0185018700 /NCGR_PEP_ID=MMETSP1103-20130426/1368_1 /TAXON_ID=36769 /ORGANISM="Paraphysomonas bandaiensis, Strain Caron Lab Isolate" /LENGTH=1198 /DNA_ID=CAMNT_0027548619 /DNA_START=161 /DNA_END=3757 /DNA_ORIENTATION=-